MLSLETSELSQPVDEPVEVCLNERCIGLGTSEFNHNFGEDPTTTFDLRDDQSRSELFVRKADGEVIAGPWRIEIPTVYPNGEGCGGEALSGRYRITADGGLESF